MSRLEWYSLEFFKDPRLVKFLIEIRDLLNGNLEPYANFKQRILTGTTPATANTAFTIQHDLNRNLAGSGPNGNEPGAEFTYWLDGAGTLYTINAANWTADSFELACTDVSRGYTVIVW